MRISVNWLREYVDFALSPQELAERLTMAGFEVESIEDRRTWADGVVVGEIVAAMPHPNADKLQVCTVDIGAKEPLHIVCGAANARAGLRVAVATVGTYLPNIDLKIRATKLRGERSEGMLCSLAELGLEKTSAGIHEFPGEPPLGSDVRPLLGLDDVVLDVTSTANRADALSLIGLAREVAALLGTQVKLPVVPLPAAPAGPPLAIADAKACPAYRGTLIRNVRVGPSPAWLQRRLQGVGIRPISNVVDITNYILWEWGQPLHAFDADTLGEPLQVGVRLAKTDEVLITLDGKERLLTTQNLVITAGDRPVALAGVMGGEATEVRDTTVNVFLEAALFDRAGIRRSARAQGLRTEASARYERGVDPAALPLASDRAIALILELAGGEVAWQSEVDSRGPLTRQIELRQEKVWQVLGGVEGPDRSIRSLEGSEIEQVLKSLAFELAPLPPRLDNGMALLRWQVTVPPFRLSDIEREIDLIEEIARVYGYEKFVETLPARTEVGYLPADISSIRQIRECLRAVGLTEVVHNSLCPAGGSQSLILSNPIAAEYGALRTDLLTGLIEAFAANLNWSNGPLNAFEIGRVFWVDGEGSAETDNLAAIFGGDRTVGDWQKQGHPLTWYEAKGLLESVFARVGVTVEYQPDSSDERFHPGRTASLWIEGERLGTFGQLHPQLRAAKGLPDEVYAFECDLYPLLDGMQRQPVPLFQPYSLFPATDRDIAFFAPLKYTAAEIGRAMVRTAGELLVGVHPIDEYRGEGVPPGCRSLAFRLIYQAGDRTLSEEDVNPVHQKVREMLVEKYGVTLRS